MSEIVIMNEPDPETVARTVQGDDWWRIERIPVCRVVTDQPIEIGPLICEVLPDSPDRPPFSWDDGEFFTVSLEDLKSCVPAKIIKHPRSESET